MVSAATLEVLQLLTWLHRRQLGSLPMLCAFRQRSTLEVPRLWAVQHVQPAAPLLARHLRHCRESSYMHTRARLAQTLDAGSQ